MKIKFYFANILQEFGIIEGNLEGKLPTIWRDEKKSREEAERRERLEKRRVEKKRVRKQKIQIREKGRKIAKYCVFLMICGSGGSKNRVAKAAGAESAGQRRNEKIISKYTKHIIPGPFLELKMSKKCTPLWHETYFEIKIYKTNQNRITFGN